MRRNDAGRPDHEPWCSRELIPNRMIRYENEFNHIARHTLTNKATMGLHTSSE